VASVGEVFVPGGLPGVTYVSRESVRLELLVEDYIDEGLKILSVSGQTKSGKTVLVRKAIPDLLELSGGDIASVSDS
jgi:type II secretory pathway predicted ATPase ExeA